MTRIKRGKLFTFHQGHTSPLIDIEPDFISTIKQMCHIRQCLTPCQGLELVSSMKEESKAQKKLIEFENKQSYTIRFGCSCKSWRWLLS